MVHTYEGRKVENLNELKPLLDRLREAHGEVT